VFQAFLDSPAKLFISQIRQRGTQAFLPPASETPQLFLLAQARLSLLLSLNTLGIENRNGISSGRQRSIAWLSDWDVAIDDGNVDR